jgi:hypothetical protein
MRTKREAVCRSHRIIRPRRSGTSYLFLPRSIPSTAIVIVPLLSSRSLRQRSADGAGGAGHPINQNKSGRLAGGDPRLHAPGGGGWQRGSGSGP